MTEPENSSCPLECPNRKSRLGKGYSYLFSIILTGILLSLRFDLKYSRINGTEFETKDVPPHLTIGLIILIGSSLGVKTDGIADTVGKLLSSGQEGAK